MKTIYAALMGAEGSDGYRPILQTAVRLDIDDITGITIPNILASVTGQLRRYVPEEELEERNLYGCDRRAIDAASAWGYSNSVRLKSGYTFWLSTTKPRTAPDPDLAWWLKPKEAESLRTRYIKQPVKGANDTEGRHEVVRRDGFRYWADDADAIRDRCCELLKSRCGVSEPTVKMVLDINGYSIDTLNDMLYSWTGETDVLDYFVDDLVAAGLLRQGEQTIRRQQEPFDEGLEDKKPNTPDPDEKKETEGEENDEDEDK